MSSQKQRTGAELQVPGSSLTGTNLWVNIVLLIGSIFGGMSGDLATQIVTAVLGIIAAAFAARNWFVNAKFKLDKSWIADPNNWAYLSAVVGALIPGAADLIPGLQDLANALISGNWTAVITAGLTLLSMAYYLFFKKPAAPAAT